MSEHGIKITLGPLGNGPGHKIELPDGRDVIDDILPKEISIECRHVFIGTGQELKLCFVFAYIFRDFPKI